MECDWDSIVDDLATWNLVLERFRVVDCCKSLVFVIAALRRMAERFEKRSDIRIGDEGFGVRMTLIVQGDPDFDTISRVVDQSRRRSRSSSDSVELLRIR